MCWAPISTSPRTSVLSFFPLFLILIFFSVCAGHLDRPVSTPVVWLEEQQSPPLHFNLARLYSLHHGSCHFDWLLFFNAFFLSITVVLVILIGILSRLCSLHQVSLHLYVTLDISFLHQSSSWSQYMMRQSLTLGWLSQWGDVSAHSAHPSEANR